jgi:hypothetical protein
MTDTALGLSNLLKVLQERVSSEVIPGTETITDSQVRVLLRVPKGPTTTRWLQIINRLLELGDEQVATKNPQWTIDISKQYFRRPDLKFGWRLIFQGKNMDKYFPLLAKEVKTLHIQAQQIEEVRLNGSPTRRVGGYSGTVPVGPAALMAGVRS